MLLKPKSTRTCTEDLENKLLIEKWMKRNSSGRVTIGQDYSIPDNSINRLNISSTKDVPSEDIKVSVSKIVKISQNVTPPTESNCKTNYLILLKHPCDALSGFTEININKAKVRQSLPLHTTELKSTNKNISVTFIGRKSDSVTQIEKVDSSESKPFIYNRKSDPNTVISPIKKNLMYNLECTKNSAIMAANRNIKSELSEKQCHIAKTVSPVKIADQKIMNEAAEKKSNTGKTISPVTIANRKIISQSTENQLNLEKTVKPIKTASKSVKNYIHTKNSMTSLLGKDKDEDVYTNLLENYRYLITPKSWSVTEFISEDKNRYIVFFNAHVVKENNILISVMRKSLIIDKGASMNYSVHGLPVNIEGTILPRILDNTKKLLSILHIFDKMQVCQGLGTDINITPTDFIFKDNCRFWRHKDCKIVLIKATQCQVCMETRNHILEKKTSAKKESLDVEWLGVKRRKF